RGGCAGQKGLIPGSHGALVRAIELNGVAVEFNVAAFELGRRLAHDRQGVFEAAAPGESAGEKIPGTLDELVEHRAAFLAGYQGPTLATRYRRLVDRVAQAEDAVARGQAALAGTVAERYFRLLAVKYESEVARLFLAPKFRSSLDAQFEPGCRIEYRMAPPVISRIDEVSGRPVKRAFGAWITPLFYLPRAMRRLRGTPLDLFGHQRTRREEHRLVDRYELTVDTELSKHKPGNHARAVGHPYWSTIH